MSRTRSHLLAVCCKPHQLRFAKAIIEQYGLSASDLFSRKAGVKGGGGKVAPKYRNPSTGETWTGRGKAPKWIDGKDRSNYLI